MTVYEALDANGWRLARGRWVKGGRSVEVIGAYVTERDADDQEIWATDEEARAVRQLEDEA